MTDPLAAFVASLSDDSPPSGLSPALLALWRDGRGDWEGAHELAQADEGADGCWAHAYLHRKEGDDGNAGYWYRRARQPVCTVAPEQEWRLIVSALLARSA